MKFEYNIKFNLQSIATTSTNGYYTENLIKRQNEIFGDEVAEYGVAELDSQVSKLEFVCNEI